MLGSPYHPHTCPYTYHQQIQRNTLINISAYCMQKTHTTYTTCQTSISPLHWQYERQQPVESLAEGCCKRNGGPTTDITTVLDWILQKQRLYTSRWWSVLLALQKKSHRKSGEASVSSRVKSPLCGEVPVFLRTLTWKRGLVAVDHHGWLPSVSRRSD